MNASKRIALFILLLGKVLTVQSQEDSTAKTDWLGLNGGFIELGYEYGLLPFYGTQKIPDQNFRTMGNLGIQIKNLPLTASFLYNSNNANVGINNYFTVGFDVQTFKQQQLEKLQSKKKGALDSIKRIDLNTANIEKKLGYLDLLKKGNIAFPLDSSILSDQMGKLPQFSWMDSLNKVKGNMNYNIPSLPIPDTSKANIMAYLEGYQSTLENTKSQLEEKKKWLEQYANMNVDSLVQNKATGQMPDISKFQKKLLLVDDFKIGLCYPSYSRFLVYQIPVNGVNFELSNQKYFLGFTHGTVQPNIFFTNNLLSNSLGSVQNVYNFFDFTNVKNGRKITSVKFGVGQKNGNHVHVGAMYGLGSINYTDTVSVGTEKNAVIEADAQYEMSGFRLQAIYGRSHIQANLIGENIQNGIFEELMEFKDRSNAFYGTVEKNFAKSGTNLQLEGRFVEPLFESFGVGFMRSDNLRYQAKIKQKIGNKGSIGGFYRREKDNILNWYDFQNVINSWGLTGTYKPTKHWRLRADFRPLSFASEYADSTFGNISTISNFIASYQKRRKKLHFMSNTLASYYNFYTESGQLNYINLGSQNNLSIKQKYIIEASYNYFATNDTSAIQESHLFTLGSSIISKKLQLNLTGKYSITSELSDWGASSNLTYRFHKNIQASLFAEKVVAGNFYSSFYLDNLKEFPYYFRGSLTFSL